MHKHFTQALYTSTLSKHFTQELYESMLSKHFIKALYQSTVSKHFILTLYQGISKRIWKIPIKHLCTTYLQGWGITKYNLFSFVRLASWRPFFRFFVLAFQTTSLKLALRSRKVQMNQTAQKFTWALPYQRWPFGGQKYKFKKMKIFGKSGVNFLIC